MSHTWGYGSTDGPAKWGEHFALAKGKCQSPIDIVTANVVVDKKLSDNPLRINYQPESNMCLNNNGHTIKADCCANSTLTGGPLGTDVYKLIQFHLHWGADDSVGAEHTINGKVYSAELHLVHWNSTAYKTFEEAVDKENGLAVLCMFIKVGKAHAGFEAISCRLGKIECKEQKCDGGKFDPKVLLPANTTRFWTYHGSLTTPPCYESVQFILFEEPLEFSKAQMTALRSLKFDKEKEGACMVNNFRPVCDIGSRKVRASFPQK